MRTIKEGDTIDVFWVNKEARLLNVKVLSMPCATGDLLYVEKEGRVYGINTNCSDFESILKRAKTI